MVPFRVCHTCVKYISPPRETLSDLLYFVIVLLCVVCYCHVRRECTSRCLCTIRTKLGPTTPKHRSIVLLLVTDFLSFPILEILHLTCRDDVVTMLHNLRLDGLPSLSLACLQANATCAPGRIYTTSCPAAPHEHHCRARP